MSLTAPTITTTISTSGYRAEMDDNFSDIQDFMTSTAANFNADPPATQGYPISMYHTGALTSGAMNAGIIVPFAGEVISAYARLNTCLTDTDADLSIELRDGSTNIFGTNTLSWDGGDAGVIKSVTTSASSLTALTAGTFIQVYTIFDTLDWTAAGGLCISLYYRYTS